MINSGQLLFFNKKLVLNLLLHILVHAPRAYIQSETLVTSGM